MTANFKDIATDLRNRANDIPQAEGESECAESRTLRAGASAIEKLLDDKQRLESLIAEFGESASVAAYYARQVHDAATSAERRAAHINAKAMNYFDPAYRKGDFA